jgi:hypothetical protein
MCIIKLDSIGNLKWENLITGSNNDTAYSIIQTRDNGYALAGTTSSYGAGGTDVSVVKLDSSGNLQWDKTIGGTGNDAAYSIVQTKDKGYALAGTTTSFGAGGNDMYIIKLDSTGQVKWTRSLGGANNEVARSIANTMDSGLVIAGTIVYSAPNEKTCLLKLNSSGDLVWVSLVSGDSSSANSILQTKSGGYIVTGSTSYFGEGSSDMYVMVLDTNGKTCAVNNFGIGISSIDSGRVSAGGSVSSFTPTVTSNASNTSSGGSITIYCSEAPTSISYLKARDTPLHIFPNPAINNITLHYSASSSEYINLSILDMTGKTISSTTIAKKGDENYTLPVSALAPGMYFIELSDSVGKLYSKFVKE